MLRKHAWALAIGCPEDNTTGVTDIAVVRDLG
jgi:hypothetical protein